jgi:hypothetical protein
MRIWFSGPHIFGIRPGVSFGPEDFRHLSPPTAPDLPPRPDEKQLAATRVCKRVSP